MFERFSDRARQVVVHAREEARRLNQDHVGTEHILLGLLADADGTAFGVLQGFGMTLSGTRDEVIAVVGVGSGAPIGHVPFTPQAKHTLELALREALQLNQKYVGTEHILLGLLRGKSAAVQVLELHADPAVIRAAVLDTQPRTLTGASHGLRWLHRRPATDPGESAVPDTGDEPSEEAGRRQMTIRLRNGLLTIEAADPVILDAARAAAQALGDKASPPGTIRGDLPECASLVTVWQALETSLRSIQRRATQRAESAGDAPGVVPEDPGDPNTPGTG